MKIQVVDVDYTTINDKPLLRIFGKTKEGESVCAFYDNFSPYFYIQYKDEVAPVIKKLQEEFGGQIKDFKLVEKYLPFGYHPEKTEVLKVIFRDPSKMRDIKDFTLGLDDVVDVYETDVRFTYRFMCDFGIKNMNWIEVEGNPERTNIVNVNRIIHATKITPLDSLEMAEFKHLAIDIEVIPSGEGMPTSDKDPIVMIALGFSPKYKDQETMILSLRDGDGAVSFNDEKEMLERLIEIIDDYDPDYITGYNMNNFDMPYIIDRMRANDVKTYMGRAKDKQAWYRRMGMGTRNSMVGRTIVDTYDIVKAESRTNPNFRFKRFTLAIVAKELLGTEKLDIGGVEGFKKAWYGSRDEFNKFVEYGRRDAELALDLLLKRSLLDKYIALCKLSGVTMQDALDGGESNRIENYLIREFFVNELLFPRKPDDGMIGRRKKEAAEVLKGGLVLDPVSGLHNDYITMVLDFKSLYPSIIRTFNICPTTMVVPESGVSDDQVYISPGGGKFVEHEVRKGIIPEILTFLVEERGRVKKEMVKHDGYMRRMLDAKQLALKIMANSFYGYCGYIRARLFVTDVANAITSYGRTLIWHVKDEIEKKRGYQIIYGDTDSVMVKSKTSDLEEAHKIADEIGVEITEGLPGYLELEYEKLFRSYLILTKKRYAAWKFEWEGDKWKEKIDMKGIETVRRDWCDLVGETLNNILNILLKEGDEKKATKYVRGIITDLEENKIPIEKLVLTKSLSKNVESYDGLMPHVELAKKMMRRDPTKSVMVGERISYVILKGMSALSTRSEDPEYASENNLSLDAKYYLENQLLPPVERIFNLIGVDKNELLGKGKQMSIFDMVKKKKPTKSEVKKEKEENESSKIIEGFTCEKCNSFSHIPPLKSVCSCGGKILFASPKGPVKVYNNA